MIYNMYTQKLGKGIKTTAIEVHARKFGKLNELFSHQNNSQNRYCFDPYFNKNETRTKRVKLPKIIQLIS